MAIHRPSISIDQAISGSFFAEGAVYQYMAVKKGTADNQVKPLDSGDTTVTVVEGIALADADDGASVPVILLGPCMGRANGAVTRGDLLEAIYSATTLLNGSLKTLATCAAGGMMTARALEDAADGAYFMVMVECRKQLAVA